MPNVIDEHLYLIFKENNQIPDINAIWSKSLLFLKKKHLFLNGNMFNLYSLKNGSTHNRFTQYDPLIRTLQGVSSFRGIHLFISEIKLRILAGRGSLLIVHKCSLKLVRQLDH